MEYPQQRHAPGYFSQSSLHPLSGRIKASKLRHFFNGRFYPDRLLEIKKNSLISQKQCQNYPQRSGFCQGYYIKLSTPSSTHWKASSTLLFPLPSNSKLIGDILIPSTYKPCHHLALAPCLSNLICTSLNNYFYIPCHLIYYALSLKKNGCLKNFKSNSFKQSSPRNSTLANSPSQPTFEGSGQLVGTDHIILVNWLKSAINHNACFGTKKNLCLPASMF